MQSKFLLLLLCCTGLYNAHAQELVSDSVKIALPPIQRFYIANGLDAAMFSSGTVQRTLNGTTTNTTAVPRFSGFLNLGVTFNVNLGRHLGAYTGIDIKNIGFIEHTGGFVTKRRTYNLGAPLGIRIGNMAEHGSYIFIGGGGDLPFNYKEKTYQIRSQKTKLSEWFSTRTPAFMPYLFAGFTIRNSISVKAQYYPANFLNPDFTTTVAGIPSVPYAGYNVHLMVLCLSYKVNYSKPPQIAKPKAEQTRVM